MTISNSMNKKYCAAPWKSLHISPQSNIQVCCYGKSNFGNLQTHDINKALQCDELKEIRRTIQTGVLHKDYCKGCIESEESSGQSERSWHNDIAGDFDCTTVDDSYYAPTLVDLRWNITCNMSCNYCNSYASSKWAKLNNDTIPNTASGKYLDNVLTFLEKHKDSIDTVALIGGEPLLLPPNEPLLDILPTKTKIMVMTNLNIDRTKNKLFKKLMLRDNVIWTISFENIGEQFEYVRYGGNWKQHESNLDYMISKQKDISIMSVYSVYNATQLNNFLDWSKRKGLSINWQLLSYPECLQASHQPLIRKKVLEELNKAINRDDIRQAEKSFFVEMKQTIEISTGNLSKTLILFNNKMESLFHKDKQGQFKKLWPEIWEALNE